MPHYVCPSCGSTAEKPSLCAQAGCTMVGRDMLECHCTDEQHGEVMARVI